MASSYEFYDVLLGVLANFRKTGKEHVAGDPTYKKQHYGAEVFRKYLHDNESHQMFFLHNWNEYQVLEGLTFKKESINNAYNTLFRNQLLKLDTSKGICDISQGIEKRFNNCPEYTFKDIGALANIKEISGRFWEEFNIQYGKSLESKTKDNFYG